MYESQIYQWALTTLQCVIFGTAIIITPTMYIGQLLGISPDNAILSSYGDWTGIYICGFKNSSFDVINKNTVSKDCVFVYAVIISKFHMNRYH